MKKILIVVDVQNDFVTGSLAVNNASDIIPVINDLMENGKYDLIIGTADWHPPRHVSFASAYQDKQPFVDMADTPYGKQALWPDHCVQLTDGSDFPLGLRSNLFDIIIRKGMNRLLDSYSAFLENDGKTFLMTDKLITDEDVVDIVGIATDYCVNFTAKDCFKYATKNVNVLLNGCRAVNPVTEQTAIAEMKELGIKVI